MNKSKYQLEKTLQEVLNDYYNESILDDADKMIEWDVKMEWLIKQLNDIHGGALLRYAFRNKKLHKGR